MTFELFKMTVSIAGTAAALILMGAFTHKFMVNRWSMDHEIKERADEQNSRFARAVSALINDVPIYYYKNGYMTRCMNIRVEIFDNGLPGQIYVETDCDDVYQVVDR